MHPAIPLSIAVLVAVGIIVIGCFYIISPERILGGFGGLATLTLLLTTDGRTVGIVLLVFAIIPFGDMANVLMSGGRKATALSVHGVTCTVMLVAGLLLTHAI
jgi:hypothetical protein